MSMFNAARELFEAPYIENNEAIKEDMLIKHRRVLDAEAYFIVNKQAIGARSGAPRHLMHPGISFSGGGTR